MNNNRLYYTSLNEIGKLYDFAIFKRRGKSHFYVLVCRQKKLMPKFQQPNCIDIIYIEVMCIIPSWECRNCIKMKLDNSLLIWRVDLP